MGGGAPTAVIPANTGAQTTSFRRRPGPRLKNRDPAKPVSTRPYDLGPDLRQDDGLCGWKEGARLTAGLKPLPAIRRGLAMGFRGRCGRALK